MKNKKETKGTKAVRECRKQMANYTREQRHELQVKSLKLIDNSGKEISESFKPLCLTCGHNRDMILHTDGNWCCHQTHRI